MSHDSVREKIDELLLQRLVDNELCHDQIRQLLAGAEFADDQSQWKQIALAFAENQLVQRSFFNADSIVSTAKLDQSREPEESVRAAQAIETAIETRKGSSKVSRPWWLAALAASLLLTLGTVYQVANTGSKVGGNALVQNGPTIESPQTQAGAGAGAGAEPATSNKTIDSFDRTSLASCEPDHQLKTEDMKTWPVTGHNGSIPLYDVQRLHPDQLASLQGDDGAAREAMFARVLPQTFSPEVVRQLQQSGGMVDQNLEFISGRLDDGRSYLIPYRTIRFLPGQ